MRAHPRDTRREAYDVVKSGSVRLLPILLIISLLFSSSGAQAAVRQPVHARKAMVVAQESLATDAGLAVLKAGGNAIDAAVAVGFALAVTYPFAGNIGGGGFLLARMLHRHWPR